MSYGEALEVVEKALKTPFARIFFYVLLLLQSSLKTMRDDYETAKSVSCQTA